MKFLTSVPFVVFLILALLVALMYGASHFLDNVQQGALQQQDNTQATTSENPTDALDSAYQSSHYATQPNQNSGNTAATKPDVSLPTTNSPSKTTTTVTTTTTTTTNTNTPKPPVKTEVQQQADRGAAATKGTSNTRNDASSTTTKTNTTTNKTTTSTKTEVNTRGNASAQPVAKTYPYLVSAGAFLNVDKAQTVLTQMRDMGYKDAYLLKTGASNKIIISAFATEKDAQDLVAKLKAKGVQATVTSK